MNKRSLNNYAISIWIFLIGSFFGFVYENILMLCKGNYALRQGLIYEPLIPIYGIGAIVLYFFFKDINLNTKSLLKKIGIIFLLSFFLGGITEYIGSYIQEKCFGTISWNYSYLRFNLQGRTSLLHASVWGLLGTIFYFFLLPLMKKIKKITTTQKGKIVTIIMSTILLFDCTISILACNRRTERRENELPSNKIEEYLDRRYPDEYIDYIYNNATEVISKVNTEK